MNYAGKFDAALSLDGQLNGQGSRSTAYDHVDSFTAKGHGHVPEGAVVIADPNLIFNGEFKRTGVDLVLSHDGHEFVVHDYFRGDKRAAIASPDGAHLTGDIVSALTGYVQVAQAAPGVAAAQVIGHVTKLTGSASAIRNGVSVILNNGDNVEKGDVVSTGSDSTLGVTFIDGTVFGLSSNARMVLNEMVYDPNGSNNSSLLSLVAGTITFVAGETAKHGDMKIDTPVATMGIRGTAVLTEINFVVPSGGGDPQPQANFQVLVEPNGTTGSYILFDKLTLLPIATVNQAGQMIQISGGNVSITNGLLSPDVQKLITDVFTLKFTDNNTNTKLTTNFTDTITQNGNIVLIKTDTGATATATFTNTVNTGNGTGQGGTEKGVDRIPGKPLVASLDQNGNPKTAFSVTERAGHTGDTADLDTVSGFFTFLDLNLGDRPTGQITFTSFTYQNAGQQDVTAGLSDLQKADIAATEIVIAAVPDSGNANNGSVHWTYSIPDHAFDFLAAGETLTLTYTIRVDNNFNVNNEFATQTFTIIITGTNDQPVITSSVPTITFAGGTSVPGGPLATKVPTSGILTFTDVDLTDTHTVSVSKFSAVLPGGTVPQSIYNFLANDLSVSIASGHDSTGSGAGTINWSLGDIPVYLADFIPKGVVLTLTYTVTVKDSQGATFDQTITVTITGTDAPAVVWIATNAPGAPSGGFWKDGANWETGTVPTISDDVIVITDQLHGLTPSYPVTIDAAAFANSLTMNDFDTAAGHKAPEVINKSSLTIAQTLTLGADSKFTNLAAGSVSVGGKAEFSGTSVLTNAGYVTLDAGGDFASGTTITNSGTIELFGGTLTTLTEIHNAGGTLKVDGGAKLIVNATTIDGGTVTILGTLELDGASLIENGALNNSGSVNVKGATELAHETVVNSSLSTIEVWANAALTIDQSSSVTNRGDVKVDGSGKLIVNGATLDGGALTLGTGLTVLGAEAPESGTTTVITGVTGIGTVTNNGELDLTGNAVLSNGILKNNSTLNVSGTGNALNGENVTNAGTIEVLTGALAIGPGSTVGNSSGNVIVDAALTLNSATLSGGAIKGAGSIDVTGASTINSSATLSVATVIADDKLTLDGVTVSGSVITDNASVELDNNVQLTNGAKIQGGPLTNNGTLEIAGAATLLNDVVTNNGTVKVDVSQTLTLSGTEISGGAVNGTGTIDVTGASTIDGGATLSTSAVTTDAKLTLDGITVSGSVITDNSSIELDNNVQLTNGAKIQGGPVTNNGTLEIAGAATLLNDVVTNNGTVKVDVSQTLTLSGTEISGGAINGSGMIDVTSASKIDGGATLSTSAVIADAKLTLDGITVSGSVITDNSSVELDNNVTLQGGAKIQGASASAKGAVTNNGTLEIAGAATLLNDVFTNNGTVKVDDGKTLTLSGTEITGGTINNYSGALGGTIDVTGDSTVDGNATVNKGGVTVESDVTLTLDNATVAGTAITNHGTVKVDASKKLTLNGASLTGGTLTVSGTLDSTGTTTVTDANISNNYLLESTLGGLLALIATTSTTAITNGGTLRANGAELDINGEAVTNTGTLAAINNGTLKLISNVVTNTDGTVSVESGSTLDLSAATVNGGTLSIAGTLESTGTSFITDADITNTGTITVTSGTLTIDPTAPYTITNSHLIQANGGELDITGEHIVNTADIKAIGGGILKLTSLIVTNDGGTVTVDGTSKLYLSGTAAINGGQLSNSGHLYGVSGSNTISAGVTNTGTIEVQAGTLNLSGGLSGAGSLVIDDGATLELAGATAQTVTFAGGADTLQLDKVAGQSFTGTIAGTSSKDGTFTIAGAADITTLSGDALDFTANGGTLAKPAGIVLTPTGALKGAANGVVVTQNGTGAISLTATKDITGLAGNGITLRDSATGAGGITVNDLTGKATGTGANSVGVLVENLNAANAGDISITQLGGAVGGAFGIDAQTRGDGDITIDAGGTITGNSIYGIRVRSYGAGSETVTTEAGSTVNSGSSGITVVNRAVSLDASADSTITVNAHGTINFGSSLNQNNNPPAGIQAGYNGATTGSAVNTDVNGSVTINNYANVTASGGYGIHAYNYGNGDVTVNDGADTTVVGASQGIRAQALSGGSGDVSVALGTNASVTGTAGYGIFAYSVDQGDVSVTMAAGDSITSGSSGIVAISYATAIVSDVGSTITVKAHGTINSGATLNDNNTTPGGIIAGYNPNGGYASSNQVYGDVIVESDATIAANGGYGIEAFNWGIGDVTVTTDTGSSITSTYAAISAFNQGVGDVSVTNEGSATGSVGLSAVAVGAGNITVANDGSLTGTSLAGVSIIQDATGATGSSHVTNTGTIVGANGAAAIYIQENTHGTATITNSGTIGPVAASVTATTYAIVETGGAITINNSGHIDGNISVASATFNNKAGGTWTVSGTSVFGALSTIDNAGEIDLHSGASISGGTGFTIGNSSDIESSGTTSISGIITNTGEIEVHTGTLTLFGSLSGSGSVAIDAGATLEVNATVSQTITFSGGGAELQIDTSNFGGSVAGFAATDKLDLSTIKFDGGTSATYDPVTGDLVVSDAYGHSIMVKLTGADYSDANFAGSSDGHGGTLITYNSADAKPTFAATETSQSAAVTEQTALTGATTTMDQSTPTGGTIHFTDIDLTDRPTATITDHAVTGLAADGTTPLTLTPDEITALENALSLQQAGKNNGAVSWTYSIADSTLDFLGQGQTVKVVSTITLDDGHKTDTAQVTITITGANDAPVITTGTSDTASATLTETNAGLTKSGTLTVSDADATDHVTASVTSVGIYLDGHLQTDGIDGLTNADLLNYLTVQPGDILNGTATHTQFSWDFNSGGQAFDFLAAGHTLSLQYTIVPNDGHTAGTGDVVTINIAGSNDAPTLDNATLTSAAGNQSNPAGDTVSHLFTDKFHDVDDGASFHAIAVTSDVATATEGVWQYEVAGTSQWVDIGSVSDANALVLGTDALIRFVPANGFTGAPDPLGVHALDNTYTGAITASRPPAKIDITAMSTDGTAPVSGQAATIGTSVTAPAGGPVIDTSHFVVSHDGELGTDTIFNLSVTNADSGASTDYFTVKAVTAPAPGVSIDLSPASGSLDDMNTAFENGITHYPGETPLDTDQITLTVTDKTTGLYDTVKFIFVAAGDTNQDVTLTGTSGKDVIFATTTGDTLTGGGGKDQFVFSPDGSGGSASHTITDFVEGLDKIDLRQFSDVSSINNLTITQQSGDTLVTWQQHFGEATEHEQLLLKSMTATLKASDFIFHIS